METALQSSVYVTSPEFAGWLTKRGFHWRKLWKKRWVALHGAEIVYMEKEPTAQNCSTMVITKAQISTSTVILRDDIEGNPLGFTIHVNDGSTPPWYLRADSAREKKSWLMRLSHVHAIVKWLEEFEKVKVLGVGGSGIVYELLHKTNGQRFAMKEIEIKNKSQMEMAVSEAEMLKEIMENVSHPSIMHIEKVFQVGSKFYLVFPLCTGGELYEHIIRKGFFTETDAAYIIYDLVSGLHALHQHDILHLDIKPENILFNGVGEDARIMITDFGLSRILKRNETGETDDSITGTGHIKYSKELFKEKLNLFIQTGELSREKLRGTIGYMAPELILTGCCSKATDVFAAGVVLYILLSGRPPFHSKVNREVLEKSVKGVYSMSGVEWEQIHPDAKDLVSKMLKNDPDERITTEEILKHPWILAHCHVNDDEIKEVDPEIKLDINNLKRNQTNKKAASINLTHALRHLSGHVKQMRTEKLATKIMSIMNDNNLNNNTSQLVKKYLIPKGSLPAESSSAPTQETDIDDSYSLYLDTDFREGLATALSNIADSENGKISLEQFMMMIKHINNEEKNKELNLGENSDKTPEKFNPNNLNSIGSLIITKFIDRDNDGFISADDIFVAQAHILQRSEIFLKVIFRVYAESLWYPGRKLNFINLMQQKNDGSSSSSSSSGGNSSILTNEAACLNSMIEPPKFITVRHIQAVFESLGYEGAPAQKAFTCLMNALARYKTEQATSDSNFPSSPTASTGSSRLSLENIIEEEEDSPLTPNYALANALNEAETTSSDYNNSPSRSPSTSSPTLTEAELLSQRMNFTDFCRAVEIDDIFVQLFFRRSRRRLASIINQARNESNDLTVKERTTDRIESELKQAFQQLKVSNSSNSSSFTSSYASSSSLTNSLTRAALGIAGKITSGASALLEATYEAMESSESHDGNETPVNKANETNSTLKDALSLLDDDDDDDDE